MKKIVISLLLLCFLCTLPISAYAKAPSVVDDAGLLTDTEINDLKQTISELIDTYGIDVAIVTVPSLNGKDVQAYADDYYDYNGYGKGKSDSGILLLYCPEYRDCAISTYGDAIKVFSDTDLDSILDNMASGIISGNYYSAFNTFLSGADFCLEQNKSALNADLKKTILHVIVTVLISAAVAGIAVYIMRKKMNNAVVQYGAESYMVQSSLSMDQVQDTFLYFNINRFRRSSSSGSGSGRSHSSGSTHHSSSGRSHGGRSRRF